MTERQDVRNLLREAGNLKRRARRLRDEGKYAEAAEPLERAIEFLDLELQRRMRVSEPSTGVVPASEETRGLAIELADCYGSLGGVMRRCERLQEALEAYEKGKQIEQNEIFRIDDSYNQVQWLVLKILLSPPFD